MDVETDNAPLHDAFRKIVNLLRESDCSDEAMRNALSEIREVSDYALKEYFNNYNAALGKKLEELRAG